MLPYAAGLADHEPRVALVQECLRHGEALFGAVLTNREIAVIAILEGVHTKTVAFGPATWMSEFNRLLPEKRTAGYVIRAEQNKIGVARKRLDESA
jgi:hypothetical protein